MLRLDGGLGEARVLQASAVLEEALAPLRARPHWGKLFSYSPQQLEELHVASTWVDEDAEA